LTSSEDTMYWEPGVEMLSRGGIESLQLSRLKDTAARAAQSSFHGRQFQSLGITPESLNGVADIQQIPFTAKEDLLQHYPYGFLAVPKHEIVRLHCSSGTTGNAISVFHNRHDLESWSNLVARSLYAVGVRHTDVFQNICGYGLFTGGLGFQYGAEKLGALAIPAAAGNSRRQVKLIQDFGTTVIHTIPSYLPRLYDTFVELGLDPQKDTQLRLIVVGAEPHTEGQRQRIQKLFGLKLFNCYGLSEMNGPAVAFECPFQTGLHLWEDCYIGEVIDPQTLEPVSTGEYGELVLTTLDRQAMPLLRYRTGDLTRFITGTCPCGRTHRRIDRISGRTDDMFIIKGCNVFPMQIESVLMRFPEVSHDYLITLTTINDVDEMIIEIELNKEMFTGDMERLENLSRRIAAETRNEILVTPIVKLAEPGSIPRSEGKAVRVKDAREKEN
jgi:phenylacetate-CoA ligase